MQVEGGILYVENNGASVYSSSPILISYCAPWFWSFNGLATGTIWFSTAMKITAWHGVWDWIIEHGLGRMNEGDDRLINYSLIA